jgi:excisionase family DNA binding protein
MMRLLMKFETKAAPSANASVYDVEQLAQELGISRQKVYAHLRTGDIPSIRLKKRFIIPRAAIQEWLKTAAGRL